MQSKQWHSRGYLPHVDVPEVIQSVTFRLHDSVPHKVVERWKLELGWREEMRSSDPISVKLRERIARYEDAGRGSCWLARPEIAHIVEDALLYFDGARYRLLAWCVMPNHVHSLVETYERYSLGNVVHSWKSFTAKEANKALGRCGAFWAKDYYDRYIRNERHLATVIRYIEGNPVQAGLVARAEAWGFSSAGA